MPLPIKDVLKMIADNTKRYGMPFPMPKEAIHRWADGLDLPKGGDTVLFTGLLYQMIPYINISVKYLESVEESKYLSILMKARAIVSTVSKLFLKVPEEELKKQYEVLRKIAMLLRKAGVRFGYLYEDDVYSGALLYDMGLDNSFKEHATMIYDKLKSLGVKKLITVDPHTTYVMREVYKNVIPGYDLVVNNYLEILAELNVDPTKALRESATLHDPCYYARYLGFINAPRRLLERGGISIVEPERTKELTFCCGGPIESIAPGLSRRIAHLRVDELSATSKNIITMCPICYANLSRVKPNDVTIKDISHYLYEVYG